jgi:hypothetical protein
MPQQETCFEEKSDDLKVTVLKTYDRAFAREAFNDMTDTACEHLWKSLGIDHQYDPADLPAPNDRGRRDFLWEEVEDAAHEDGNLCSFFVVSEAKGDTDESVYVSPDWPSAEAFARHRLHPVH